MAAYTYDPRSARYRAPDGRYVSQKQLHGGVVKMAEASGERMAGLATGLQSGQMKLAEWQAAAMQEIKSSNMAATLAAHGGRNMMAPADYLVAARDIKAQYGYIKQWSADIASGKAPLDGRLVARARLYGRHSVAAFVNMQTRDARVSGAVMEERWILGSADHCSGCPGQAARGYVPLGQLPEIGSQPCRANCSCSKVFRKVPVDVAA